MIYLVSQGLIKAQALNGPTFLEFGALEVGDDGLQYASGEEKPFTGVSVEFYPDGTKRNIYTWKNGKENGLHKIWHEGTSLKKQEVQYSEGLMDGTAIRWHPDGQLKSLEHYAKGKKQGLFLKWHPNGQLAKAGFYEDDQPAGLALEKAPDGTLLNELLFSEGKLFKPPKKD